MDGSAPKTVGGIAGDQLKSIVERVERIEAERKALSDDLKDLYAEAGGNGFDKKIIRKIVALRKRDQADIDEEESLMDTYLAALGGLPLFESAGRE